MKRKVPIGALAAFFYRDYGLILESKDVSRVIDLFRAEFGLTDAIADEKLVFDTLFVDDANKFTTDDLLLLEEGQAHG